MGDQLDPGDHHDQEDQRKDPTGEEVDDQADREQRHGRQYCEVALDDAVGLERGDRVAGVVWSPRERLVLDRLEDGRCHVVERLSVSTLDVRIHEHPEHVLLVRYQRLAVESVSAHSCANSFDGFIDSIEVDEPRSVDSAVDAANVFCIGEADDPTNVGHTQDLVG